MEKIVPNCENLIEKLNGICSSDLAREEVAAWAMAIIDDDEIRVHNIFILKMLKRLGGVDLLSDKGGYLYDLEDIRAWQEEIYRSM